MADRFSSSAARPLDIAAPSARSAYSMIEEHNHSGGVMHVGAHPVRMRSATSTPSTGVPLSRSMAETSVDLRNSSMYLSRIGMTWDFPPRTVLVVAKYKASEVFPMLLGLTERLAEELHLTVLLESYHWESDIVHHPQWAAVAESPNVHVFDPKDEARAREIDFVVTLGGDGTVLYAASLLQVESPPFVCFHLGSLGFLTTFDFEEQAAVIDNVIAGGARLNLRMRLRCTVERSDGTHDPTEHHVLNEVVLERGSSSYLAQLHLLIDNRCVTTIHADGIIISTPTGSSAYSLSAGGSICHPALPGVLVTPVCPHTLSFRPLVLPDSVEITLFNPPDSRSSVFAAFDGRSRVEIRRGDKVRIRASPWPIPTVCHSDATQDWFDSLSRCLNWNVRDTQRPFEPAQERSLARTFSRVGMKPT